MTFTAGLLLLALVLPPVPGDLLVIAVAVIATLAVARVPLTVYAKVMTVPLVFLLIGVGATAVQPVAAAALASCVSPRRPTAGAALRVALRAAAGLTTLIFLALSTPLPQILLALRRMGMPAVVVEVAALVYRSIWTFVETVAATRRAQAARLGYRSLRQVVSLTRHARRLVLRPLVAARPGAWRTASPRATGTASCGCSTRRPPSPPGTSP